MSPEAERSLVCIACPVGCRLSVRQEDGGEIRVSGNQCEKGEVYGREELLAPKRVVTLTVALSGAPLRRLPVKTLKPLPREHIAALLKEASRLRVSAPVARGQVLLADFQGTGVDLVATRTVRQARDAGSTAPGAGRPPA
jgi:CxxC motif-containing protein